MDNLITIKGVRGYIDENGIAQLNLEDISRGLGFTETAASGNETIRWRTVKEYLSCFNFIAPCCDGPTEVSKNTFVPENIFYRLERKGITPINTLCLITCFKSSSIKGWRFFASIKLGDLITPCSVLLVDIFFV